MDLKWLTGMYIEDKKVENLRQKYAVWINLMELLWMLHTIMCVVVARIWESKLSKQKANQFYDMCNNSVAALANNDNTGIRVCCLLFTWLSTRYSTYKANGLLTYKSMIYLAVNTIKKVVL